MSDARFPRGAPDALRTARRAVLAGRFREAWEALRQMETGRETAEWLLLAAMASWRLGAYERSRTAALQARDRYRTVGDLDGVMRSENVAAAGAFAMGDLDDATRGFTRALTLADGLHDPLMTARCANNLGNVEYYHARLDTALGFYRLAIATFEKVASLSGLAEACLNTAIVAREQGEILASQRAAERAVGYAERAENERLFGQALAASAETSAAAADVPLAHAQAQHALRIARTNDDPLGETDALRITALLCLQGHEPERAKELALEALARARRVNHPWAVAEVQRALGEIYEGLGEVHRAAHAFDSAAAAYGRMGSTARASLMTERARSLER